MTPTGWFDYRGLGLLGLHGHLGRCNTGHLAKEPP